MGGGSKGEGRLFGRPGAGALRGPGQRKRAPKRAREKEARPQVALEAQAFNRLRLNGDSRCGDQAGDLQTGAVWPGDKTASRDGDLLPPVAGVVDGLALSLANGSGQRLRQPQNQALVDGEPQPAGQRDEGGALPDDAGLGVQARFAGQRGAGGLARGVDPHAMGEAAPWAGVGHGQLHARLADQGQGLGGGAPIDPQGGAGPAPGGPGEGAVLGGGRGRGSGGGLPDRGRRWGG